MFRLVTLETEDKFANKTESNAFHIKLDLNPDWTSAPKSRSHLHSESERLARHGQMSGRAKGMYVFSLSAIVVDNRSSDDAVASICYFADSPSKDQAWAGARVTFWIGYGRLTIDPHADDWFHSESRNR